jgi:D-sedoheptulose 7-phosphate isomerase
MLSFISFPPSRFIDAFRNLWAIEYMAQGLAWIRERGGRVFFLGVGGSAGNCGHAVNDFRKILGIEAYAPTDNVSELTARTNDEGWETVFVEWLKVSQLMRLAAFPEVEEQPR